MHFLYNIGIRLFGLGIRITSLFNEKAKKWITGRKDLNTIPEGAKGKKVIWMHCASLGEFDQGLPVLAKLKDVYPQHFLLVTFFSPSGMDHYHKRDHCGDHVEYLALDTPANARKFVTRWNPDIGIFVKYEFWSNHIIESKKSGTRLYNISGLFRKDHRFFKWYGSFFRETLNKFDWFFVQNVESNNLLESIGIKNTTVTGDNRFDRVIENKKSATSVNILDSFCKDQETFIIGSSWPQDEEILISVINESEVKVIIAPHNVDDKHVQNITSKLIVPFCLITDCTEEQASNARVLVLNTIGQLSNAYSYGNYAYVGGGFSGSLHNILEPAVFGLPVIFGPKHSRFPEGEQFIQAGFGFSVSNAGELKEVIKKIEANADSISKKAEEFVSKNAGASQRIVDKITSS
jgi:3-deoxy-D-manno-octulosonic-acid transferase